MLKGAHDCQYECVTVKKIIPILPEAFLLLQAKVDGPSSGNVSEFPTYYFNENEKKKKKKNMVKP